MKTLRVGGVPEHFNTPWHLGIEEGLFEKSGLSIDWTVFRGGTGQMTKALRDDEIDVCVLLTEGIVADIIKGNSARIIGKYINTPLIWGVFTGRENPIQYYGEIYKGKYAISRFGSGSHLMAIVDAFSKNKVIEEHQWKVIKNLEGALQALSQLETDAFYWEKYTTQPYVANGTLRELGAYVTPWPSFVLAANEKILSTGTPELKKMLSVIYFLNEQLMYAPSALEIIGQRHPNIDPEQLERWFHTTEWATNDVISPKMLDNVVNTLFTAGIVEQKIPASDLCVKL